MSDLIAEDEDPVAEVRRVREEYGAKFDFDIDRMADDLQRRRQLYGRWLMPLEPSDVPNRS